MKILYLVPVIHNMSDLGSAAAALDKSAAARLGDATWRHHKEIVSKFWDSMAVFFSNLAVMGWKIYQDGLVADGAVGLHIVNHCVQGGSRNYEIVGNLLKRGAILVKTEDIALVNEEQTHVKKIVLSKTLREAESAALKYKMVQDRLLNQRDAYIARRIAETLNEGERGILFIGAYHNLLNHIPDDVSIIQIKDINKMKEYHKAMILGRDSEFLRKHESYITAPVTNIQI